LLRKRPNSSLFARLLSKGAGEFGSGTESTQQSHLAQVAHFARRADNRDHGNQEPGGDHVIRSTARLFEFVGRAHNSTTAVTRRPSPDQPPQKAQLARANRSAAGLQTPKEGATFVGVQGGVERR
jgi:hypothetical protein